MLSTHTAGFTGYTVRDLTEDIPAIAAHWRKENIRFDAVYTGYLGSTEQIAYVKEIFETLGAADLVTMVDPAMADNGKLYPAFDEKYVEAMKTLAFSADIILPNITEACFLTGMEYRETYDKAYIEELIARLKAAGAKTVILTGVSYGTETTGVLVAEPDQTSYYEHVKLPKSSHGTGDVYASAFAGAYLNGKSAYDAAKIAADYTVKCIENTADDDSHWYGVKFEPVLPYYIDLLK